jgi:hypothetical protein
VRLTLAETGEENEAALGEEFEVNTVATADFTFSF